MGTVRKKQQRRSYIIGNLKTPNRIAAERYVYARKNFFTVSVTKDDIERAICKVEKALDELVLKPVFRTDSTNQN